MRIIVIIPYTAVKTRGDIPFILMDYPRSHGSRTAMAEQPSQTAEGLSLHSTDVPARALFLAGIEGGFLSSETLLPLLVLPSRLHHRAVTGKRHTSQLGRNTIWSHPPPPRMSEYILNRSDSDSAADNPDQ